MQKHVPMRAHTQVKTLKVLFGAIPQLQSEFETTLGYWRPCLRKQNKRYTTLLCNSINRKMQISFVFVSFTFFIQNTKN